MQNLRLLSPRWRTVCTCAGLVAAFAIPAFAADPDDRVTIPWRTGTAEVFVQSADEVAVALDDSAGAAAGRHVVVSFREPVSAGARQQLADLGLRLLSPVGRGSYFAATDGAFDGLGEAGRLIAAVTEIVPLWKQHPHFFEVGVPEWAVVDDETEGVNPTVAVYVLFHGDVPLWPEAWSEAVMHGARVRSQLKSVNALVVEMPYLMIEQLALSDLVQYIEPALPKFVELNNSNRDRTGASTAQALPYGLDGTGVKVLVYDGGFALESHQDFGGRLTVRDSAGLSDHATHVSGTIGGDGAASSGQYRGMAPAVTIESYGFEQEGGLSEGFLYTDPGDIEADYGEAINTYGVDISNNSIGTNTAPNGFPCEWEGDYGITSTVIDSIVRGSLGGEPFRIIWANGNERQGFAPCGSTYHTTAPPACAKNHITVGALNSNDDSMTDFSSWGPADDGRLKPDISAPGCQSDDDNTVTSCSSSGGYTGKCGTSMAAPTVTGLSALILQDYRATYPGRSDFRNSTLKAVLAHTAEDPGNIGPDYQFGYGSARVVPAIEQFRSGNFLENEIAQGQTVSVLVSVGAGEGPLKVTLAWDDVPGTPNVDPALVNDLDLEVYDPQQTRHFPWTLDPANPGDPAVRTIEDHINNIEQVVIDAPQPGIYRVDIVGFNVAQGPQSFSLTASPLLINCSSTGVASFDRAFYNCEGTAVVRVVDCDLNTDDGVVETVTVTVSSDSEPAGESLVLTETGPETSTFEASIALDLDDAPGVIQVADGDTLSAEYIDADDGFGNLNVDVTTTATIDCVPPMVTSVTTFEVGPMSAKVQILTSELVQANIRFDVGCEALGLAVGSASFKVDHVLTLSGLQDNEQYHYEVDLVDQAGNAITVTDNGECFVFTTPEIPDYFTEQFAGDNDLDFQTITYAPNGTFDFYGICIEPNAALPTDPAGGTVVTLTDDGSQEITLNGGETVSLYGTAWSSFFINANGNLTFTGSDGDYTETIGEHFGEPRIALHWDDLNPSAGGTVSWRQLADRVAVTWDDVPEFSSSNSNTFQVELFFDGTIALSYGQIDSTDGLSGLSEGAGQPESFFEMDLSAAGPCGTFPPNAGGQTVETPLDTEVTITLVAVDDGDPNPPGGLTYAISALPAEALRDAGTDQVITAGELPYTLAAGGSQVIYAPLGGFTGIDSFDFYADDGGAAPDGGPSAAATIGILVGDPSVAHAFPLDTDPGWTTSGDWGFGQPTAGGFPPSTPGSGHTGDTVYAYNLTGNYPNNLPQTQYLTTGAIDCSSLVGTTLEFWRWLGIQSSSFDHADIQASSNGVQWTTVWEHAGGSFNDLAWTRQSVDISSVADGESTVFIRWGMGTTDGSVTFPGWYIDDISILGYAPGINGVLGDADGDGDVDVDDIVEVILGWGECPPAGPCPGDLNGDGFVDIDDVVLVVLNFDTPAPALAGGAGGGAGADDPSAADDAVRRGETDDAVALAPGAPAALVNDGVLAPVEYGGVVEVPGRFRQTARGVLVIELTGVDPISEHDVLVVRDTATLDGGLRAVFVDGYVPQPGDEFVILVARRIAGAFERVEVEGLDEAVAASLIEVRRDGALALRVVAAPDRDAPEPAALAEPDGAGARRGDLDGNDRVDVSDVLLLLEAWGAAPGDAADLDGDGAVGGADLRLLLTAHWTGR